jgi:putative tryptophan/tyrosine transport system substrate-binding protein
MHRRQVISLVGGAAAWPLAARAQQAAKRIGIFTASAANPVMGPASKAFFDELRKLGFVEGRNLIVDRKPSDMDISAVSAQAAAMVRATPDVLVALGSEPLLEAFVHASKTIPIVFVANNYDPLEGGYVQSLAKPGGNVTGVFLRQTELAEKQVALLTEAFPERRRLAVLWDRISADQFEAAERRAGLQGLEVISRKMENPPYDIRAAFQDFAQAKAGMLLLLSSPFFAMRREDIVSLAIQYRLPSMFIFKPYVEAGGLISYGVDNVAMYRQGATIVGKILNGARAHELPVEQPTKFEMALNLKTAKAIGVELPTSILIRADEVIE